MTAKPTWAQNVVATPMGWVNPKTNELVSIVPGLTDTLPFENDKIVWPEHIVNAKAALKAAKAAAELVTSSTNETLAAKTESTAQKAIKVAAAATVSAATTAISAAALAANNAAAAATAAVAVADTQSDIADAAYALAVKNSTDNPGVVSLVDVKNIAAELKAKANAYLATALEQEAIAVAAALAAQP